MRVAGAVLLLSLAAVSGVPATASDVAPAAALRLPEPKSRSAATRMEQALFKPLTPYAVDAAPVRLPADQALSPAESDAKARSDRRN